MRCTWHAKTHLSDFMFCSLKGLDWQDWLWWLSAHINLYVLLLSYKGLDLSSPLVHCETSTTVNVGNSSTIINKKGLQGLLIINDDMYTHRRPQHSLDSVTVYWGIFPRRQLHLRSTLSKPALSLPATGMLTCCPITVGSMRVPFCDAAHVGAHLRLKPTKS